MTPAWLEGTIPSVEEIRRRVAILISEQDDTRNFVRREIGAKTIFVLLYGFAVEGAGTWIRPTAVTDMTDAQASKQDPETRRSWLRVVQSRKRSREVSGRWYGENTRESIRDETLRTMVDSGIVIEREGLPTTSPRPRYALALDFTELLNPNISTAELMSLGKTWREQHLSKEAMTRRALLRKGAGSEGDHVLVTFPNGEARKLAPGPSALLTRAVLQEFAPRFLRQPAVVLVSESARKITYQDESVIRSIGLNIDKSSTLPDVILVDLGAQPALLVFVECVVTDGPVTRRRRTELEDLARAAGFVPGSCVFVTAFHDRANSPFRAMASSVAWRSFVWFETEPDCIVQFRNAKDDLTAKGSALLD